MPSGSKSSSTQTTQVQAPIAVNPYMSTLFNQTFGAMTPGAQSTVQNVESGKQLTNNISQLYSSLQQNSSNAYQTGVASIKAAMGASGTALSTGTSTAIGNYAGNYIQNLNQTATSMGLQEEGGQIGVAEGVLSSVSQAGNQYYSPGSTTTGSSTTQQTGLGAWADPVMGLAGAAFGAAGAAGSFSSLFS